MEKKFQKNKAAGGRIKKKVMGRPAGSAGAKHDYIRDEEFNKFRCSAGFNKVVAMLVESGLYKSKADVLHEAVQRLAFGKDTDVEHYSFWRGKIQ